MIPSRKIPLLLAALVGLGALAWFWLKAPGNTAKWLNVEVPRTAIVGQPLTVRIETNANTPAVLSTDLHWSSSRRESRGYLSSGSNQPAGKPGTTLIFRPNVPAQNDLGYVRVVVFAGPTAGWDQRTEAATSDYIPVETRGAGVQNEPKLREIAMFDQRPDPAAFREDSVALQATISGLWAAMAAVWWRRRGEVVTSASGGRALVLACLTAAIWETLPMEGMVGEYVRALAIEHRWYANREGLQIFGTSLVAVMAVAGIMVTWLRNPDSARRFAWLGLGGYAGVSLASLCSLHKVDAILASLVLGVSTLQWIQLAAAGLAVVGGVSRAQPPRSQVADQGLIS